MHDFVYDYGADKLAAGSRDVTKFAFEFKRWRISQNFTAFDIEGMLKLPSRRMRI